MTNETAIAFIEERTHGVTITGATRDAYGSVIVAYNLDGIAHRAVVWCLSDGRVYGAHID